MKERYFHCLVVDTYILQLLAVTLGALALNQSAAVKLQQCRRQSQSQSHRTFQKYNAYAALYTEKQVSWLSFFAAISHALLLTWTYLN